MKSITEMEKKVLTALYESSKGNGHDFGLIEECRAAVEQPRQLAGIMSSLSQKGLISIHGEVTTDSGSWTQTTWKVELKEIEEILGVAACDACNKTYQRDPKGNNNGLCFDCSEFSDEIVKGEK